MSEDMEALYEASFTLIGIAGDSKAESMQAIDCCKQGDFEGARKHLAAADETMVKAHDAQTEMAATGGRRQSCAGKHHSGARTGPFDHGTGDARYGRAVYGFVPDGADPERKQVKS